MSEPCRSCNRTHTPWNSPDTIISRYDPSPRVPARADRRALRTSHRRSAPLHRVPSGAAQRTLHLTWFAFFLTFVVWFNFAPFATTIGEQFGLSKAQLVTLGLCNLALTVPARIIIGGLLDRFGPRRTFSAILVFAVVPCTLFATADSFEMLVVSRLHDRRRRCRLRRRASGWCRSGSRRPRSAPPRASTAGGATSVPPRPTLAPPDRRRRRSVDPTAGDGPSASPVCSPRSTASPTSASSTTPRTGSPYVRARRASALEVTSRGAVWGLMAMSVPLGRRPRASSPGGSGTSTSSRARCSPSPSPALAVLLGIQIMAVLKVNTAARRNAVPARRAVPVPLGGGALARLHVHVRLRARRRVLPARASSRSTWGLSTTVAGAAASTFAVMNLVSRPAGGLLSDVVRSRRRWLAAAARRSASATSSLPGCPRLAARSGHRHGARRLAVRPGRQRRRVRHRAAGQEAGERPDRRPGRRLRQRRRHRLPHRRCCSSRPRACSW